MICSKCGKIKQNPRAKKCNLCFYKERYAKSYQSNMSRTGEVNEKRKKDKELRDELYVPEARDSGYF